MTIPAAPPAQEMASHPASATQSPAKASATASAATSAAPPAAIPAANNAAAADPSAGNDPAGEHKKDGLGDINTASPSAATPNNNHDFDYIIIRGETLSGSKFRPSDWCERLHGALRALGDDADEIADLVHLANYREQKCVIIEKELEERRQEVYNFFLRFAHDNKLSIEHLSKQDWDSLRN